MCTADLGHTEKDLKSFLTNKPAADVQKLLALVISTPAAEALYEDLLLSTGLSKGITTPHYRTVSIPHPFFIHIVAFISVETPFISTPGKFQPIYFTALSVWFY